MVDIELRAMAVIDDVFAGRINYKDGKCQTRTADLHDLLREQKASDSSRIIFVQSRDHYGKCHYCQRILKEEWGCPQFLFEPACCESNGYASIFKQDVGSGEPEVVKYLRCLVKSIRLGTDGEIRYEWYEMTILIRLRNGGQASIICFGVPGDILEKFTDAIIKVAADGPTRTNSEHLEAAMVIEVVRLYDESIWAIAKIIRKFEKSRRTFDFDFEMMHELLRHTIHTTEVLQVAVDSFKELSKPTTMDAIPDGQHYSLKHQMEFTQYEFWYRFLQNYIQRSRSNECRLKNEIQLAMNLVAQKDSRATVELSQSSQRDSAAMRVIAIVTLIFLPATFVATLFSMSFFNYDQDTGWKVAKQIWIYWVVAAPLTVFTILAWGGTQLYLHKEQEKQHIKRSMSFLSTA